MLARNYIDFIVLRTSSTTITRTCKLGIIRTIWLVYFQRVILFIIKLNVIFACGLSTCSISIKAIKCVIPIILRI